MGFMREIFTPNEEQMKVLQELELHIKLDYAATDEMLDETSADSIKNWTCRNELRSWLLQEANEVGIPWLEIVDLDLSASPLKDRQMVLDSVMNSESLSFEDKAFLMEKYKK